ncbi:MAG TPA: hypothetical protein VKV03_10810 [Candidatus Binataceae bacterium]|nr:hypothetical protein [Candidatus Binataceae bacterium]
MLAGLRPSTVIHTREEVADKGVDLSRDAGHECVQVMPEVASASRPHQLADEVEIEVSPPHRFLHRRVSPSSSDDGFHSALQ